MSSAYQSLYDGYLIYFKTSLCTVSTSTLTFKVNYRHHFHGEGICKLYDQNTVLFCGGSKTWVVGIELETCIMKSKSLEERWFSPVIFSICHRISISETYRIFRL